jgi:hypothetical protein
MTWYILKAKNLGEVAKELTSYGMKPDSRVELHRAEDGTPGFKVWVEDPQPPKNMAQELGDIVKVVKGVMDDIRFWR